MTSSRACLVFTILVLPACGGLPDGVELPTSERQDLVAVGLIGQRCSATAIDVGGPDDAPAYVLTAGHCAGLSQLIAPEVINHDNPTLGDLSFGVFTDTEDSPIIVPNAGREYASLLGVDLGIYRLTVTAGELRAAGVTPMPLAPAPPAEGEPIAIAGFPHTTEDDPRRVLHLSHCDLGETVRIAEHGMVWIDFLQSSCNSIRDGSSGGPLLDEDGRVFGVLSTALEPGGPPCSLDHPCEVDGDSARTRGDAVYGAPIRTLAACFTDGVFDLEHAGCLFARPELPVILEDQPASVGDAWNVTLLDGPFPYYRTKAGLATEVRCEDDAGFGPPIAVAERPRIDDPIPAEPRGEPYVLCIQGLADATEAPRARFLDRTIMLQVPIPE